MINIKITKSTRMVDTQKSFIGNDLENLQETLSFTFTDEFVNGSARLEYDIDGEKHHIPMTKDGESYNVPIRNVITKEGNIDMQLVIVEANIDEEIPVFKSNVFYMYCARSINAQEEAPDDYEYWLDVLQEKIAEVENLNITSERVEDGVEITFTDKQGNETIRKVNDGSDGEDAKINGYNTITITGGTNIDFEQDGNTFTINNTYDDTEIKEDISTLNTNVETLSNAISEHDTDIQNIQNDIDTLEQDVDSLGIEIDNLDINKQEKLTAGTNITIENNVISSSGGTSDFDQLTNRPKYNGTEMTHSTNIPLVPTKTSDLTNDSNFVSDNNYVHTDNNYTSAEKTKLDGIEGGAEVNNVDDIQINGVSILDSLKVANIEIEDNVVSTDTNKPLSANMGKELNDRIQNLASIGKYLAMWDCTTGLPTTNPIQMPYTYTTGDYYVISKIEETTNYMPYGSTYNGTASTTEYTGTETLNVGDFFYYDGTLWSLMKNTGKTVSFANISGSPMDNSNLASTLNNKVGFTNYASSSTGGVIKTNSNVATSVDSNGTFYGTTKTYGEYTNGAGTMIISKGTLENVLIGKGIIDSNDVQY